MKTIAELRKKPWELDEGADYLQQWLDHVDVTSATRAPPPRVSLFQRIPHDQSNIMLFASQYEFARHEPKCMFVKQAAPEVNYKARSKPKAKAKPKANRKAKKRPRVCPEIDDMSGMSALDQLDSPAGDDESSP